MNDTCHICGESDNLVPVTINNETIYLCSECKEAHLKQCSQCDDFFIDTENDYAVSRDGEIYCEFCRDEYLSYCEHCDEYSDSEDFVHLVDTDEWWCRSCAERDAYQCMDCFDWVTENHGDSNRILCSDCFESHYTYCDDCGDLVNLDDCYSTDDGIYCEYCYNENHTSLIHGYSYEPCLEFQKSDDDTEKILPYLGFELESGGLPSNSACKNIAESISDDEETFYLKEDGSIPEYGFELVSHPITLKRHKELDWEDIFNRMSNAGLKSHDLGAESCGLHVHVSRNYLTPYRWMLIDWFISKYQTQFETIARRKETHWARYKKSDGQPLKDVYGKSSGTRYQAVNFENRNTVEFRLFRGTLKYSTFMATLEIVDALVHWAKHLAIHDILTCGNAFANFTQFISANDELYSNAVNYLKSKNLM